MGNLFTTFVNCRLCINGQIVEGERLVVSQDTGKILESTGYIGGEIVDLEDAIIAPGFLELHTTGVNGFHFTDFKDGQQYRGKLEQTARYYVSQGVTGFWATVPTVEAELYHKILPSLSPTPFPSSASLLGAHAEGPYLSPTKPGTHNPTHLTTPSTPPESIYGPTALSSTALKLVTLAPDLHPDPNHLITALTSSNIRVSLGHTSASYAQGLAALAAGASGLTLPLGDSSPLHARDPGVAGLITLREERGAPPPPFYSIAADGAHMHPAIATMLFRAAPRRALLVGHAGEGATAGQCVRNLVGWSGCGVGEAVQCVTENVAEFMGEGGRGMLEVGRRADFVVLDDGADVLETWVAGVKVWEKE